MAQKHGADAARLERDAVTSLRTLEGAARAAQAELSDPTYPDMSWLTMSTRMMGAAVGGPPPEAEADKPRIVL
jgi:hypothetical protein